MEAFFKGLNMRKDESMNIGIIGCGLIGNKRAMVIGRHTIRWLVDSDLAKAETMVQKLSFSPII